MPHTGSVPNRPTLAGGRRRTRLPGGIPQTAGPTGRGSSEWAAGSGGELNPLSFLGANPSVNLTIRHQTTFATADRRLHRWQMADMRGDADPAAKQTTIPGNVPTPQ